KTRPKQTGTPCLNDTRQRTVLVEQIGIVYALGCTKDTTILSNYIKTTYDSTDKKIKTEHFGYVFKGIVENTREGFKLMKEYFFKHLGKDAATAWNLCSLIGQCQTEEELKEFQTFKASGDFDKYFKGSRTIVDQAEEDAMIQVKWHQQSLTNITAVLETLTANKTQ
ncbi:hypothetical protein WDU94_006997, partial [Cyamophila willieti]